MTHETRRMKLSDLKPVSWNPRAISDRALSGLKKSIERFGLVQPIIVNSHDGAMTVVGGHQRIKAMIDLGETETDVIIVDLPPAEEKALNVALNSQAISGDWTAELDDILNDIKVELPDVYVDLLLADLELKVVTPPDEFKEYGEDIETDYQCPKCGYSWSGKKKNE